ncbi:MAG: Spy/CpxP family protein refolding chaperone [Hyphomicrobiaceae bacterium]|nr:Spy/CpxP family protein refolding chaperone [Hyphomicrobiaceae bacterium]
MSMTPYEPSRPSRRRSALILAAAILAGGVIGGFATTALSQGPFGHGFGHHGGWHKVGFFMAPHSIEDAQDRAQRMARHLAVEVDATPEQTDKLIVIAKGLAADVFPLRKSMQDARTRGLDLMTSPAIDRGAIEALRAEQMDKADALTKRLAGALADAADVLNAEQRTKLATRIQNFRDRWGSGHHKPPRD